MDRELYQKLKRSGEAFHCPEGHAMHFTETTESRLRERIGELESQLQRKAKRVEQLEGWLSDAGQKRRRETSKRKTIQRALLPAINGVIEVDEDMWLWGCACGGAAYTIFENRERAEEALRQHHEKSCDGGIDERIESIQNVASNAIAGNND